MFKNLIAPIQAWLLSQGRCVACGTEIKSGRVSTIQNRSVVTCRCGRSYIRLPNNTFRRAVQSELK